MLVSLPGDMGTAALTGMTAPPPAVDSFRSDEARFAPAAVVLLDDETAQTVAALWLTGAPRDVAPGASWQQAWDAVGIDDAAGEIAAVSGLRAALVRAKLDLLVRARLVYPDGTVSAKCGEILRARIVEHTAGAVSAARKARKGA